MRKRGQPPPHNPRPRLPSRARPEIIAAHRAYIIEMLGQFDFTTANDGRVVGSYVRLMHPGGLAAWVSNRHVRLFDRRRQFDRWFTVLDAKMIEPVLRQHVGCRHF